MTDIKDSDQNQTKTRHPKNDDKRRQGSFNKIRTAHIQVRQLVPVVIIIPVQVQNPITILLASSFMCWCLDVSQEYSKLLKADVPQST